ncbi:MAG: TetR/AcrR family transcriptional regulator [Nocardioidaceae bacterium]
MRSARGDLTARAAIRNAALRLFAEHGPDAVSVRQIASEAEVSPALVLHHFGNKAGLRDAVDAHAARTFEELFEVGEREDVAKMLASGDGRSIAEVFASAFPPDSPLPAYLRRLILAGDPAGVELFGRWHDATRALLDAMGEMGLVAPSADPEVRSAFVLVNDLALILLRGPIEAVLGFDPLGPDGMARWGQEVTTVYRDGLWAAPDEADTHGTEPGPATESE